MQIIGLGTTSRSGKDSFANAFKAEMLRIRPGMRVVKMPFAWKLKQMCHELYGWAGVERPEYYETQEGEEHRNDKLVKLASKIWPEGPTVVELWIAMGTDAVRNHIYPTTWLDYVLNTDHDCEILIVPDVRFWNEVQGLRKKGAFLIKMIREGHYPRASRADTELYHYRGWDMAVSGTFEDITVTARDLAKMYANGYSAKGQYPLTTRRAYEVEVKNEVNYSPSLLSAIEEHAIKEFPNAS